MPAMEIAVIGMLRKPIEDLYALALKGFKREWCNWKDEAAIGRAESSIKELSLVRTITSRHPMQLDEFYYPARMSIKGKKSITVSALSEMEMALGGRCFYIVGTAGQGKSVFLKYLCVEEAKKGERIPLLILLRKIDEKTKINDLLFEAFFNLGMDLAGSVERLNFVLGNSKLCMFLDGLDEVNREWLIEFKADLKNLIAKHEGTTWVVSSRPGALLDNMMELGGFSGGSIAKLDEADFQPFMKKIGVKEESLVRLLGALNANSNKKIKGVLDTPLMLTLLVQVYGDSVIIPDNLPDFYNALYNTLSTTHDETKPGFLRQKATALSNSDLRIIFECFSYASLEMGKTSLTIDQFEDCCRRARMATGLTFTPEGLRTDLTETLCLLVKEGADSTFIHKTVQEFFAAFFIKRIDDEEIASKIYATFSCFERIVYWENVLECLSIVDKYKYTKHFLIPDLEGFVSSYPLLARNGRLRKTEFNKLISSMGCIVHSLQGVHRVLMMVDKVDSLSVKRAHVIISKILGGKVRGGGASPTLAGIIKADSLLKEEVFEAMNDYLVRLNDELKAAKYYVEKKRVNWSQLFNASVG